MTRAVAHTAYGLLTAAFVWLGAYSPSVRLLADDCRGLGSQDPVTGQLTFGCVSGTCTTGSCSIERDATSAPGFTIEFCTCRHPDGSLDCDFTSRKCVTLRVTDSNGVKAFWCKACNCPDPNATEPMHEIRGKCQLNAATAIQRSLCSCKTGSVPEDEEEG